MGTMNRDRVTAVLGPTNTGKTYLAIERMLGYRSGMIGFPLRLLARENYDRAVAAKGRAAVALVTGEEKIVPPGARYFFCTVESMPLDRRVDFLAIDEVQLAADPERGHVFTDRLLHARGEVETMLLGADTILPVLRRLVPGAELVSRPRFSTLSYAGPRKITRLPPRSAVVAFSAADVYALAELMRRQRGGTAVVLGALSPRTRNAQVALFEAGEVDYLVATDAIGMGLNLNLDHVAFSRLRKFDGRGPRQLTPAEVAQIAGRAGRHMNDGTFGTTGSRGPMPPELVEAVEGHRFDPHRFAFWRNPSLDFASPKALLASLERRPPLPELVRAREAGDQAVLVALAGDAEILDRARNRPAVALLWEVCQIPDFRNTLTDQHAALLRRIYLLLTEGGGGLPDDWVAKQIARIERVDGDIDALVARIAHIRTWTYIAHRGDWLADSQHWQERTRAVEDRLSDALHERLTQRFVDRRTAVLVRRLKEGEALIGAVRANGEVLVEGEFVGRLEGFAFAPDESVGGEDAKALFTAARRALADEIPRRVRRLEDEDDGAFALDPAGTLLWHGVAVARLKAGPSPLRPGVSVLDSEFLDGAQRERIRRRVSLWLDAFLRRRLRILYRAAEADAGPQARGLLFQLGQALGTLPRRSVAAQVAALTKADRKALGRLGLRLGAAALFFPDLLRPRATALRSLLWTVHAGRPAADPPRVPGLRLDREVAALPDEPGFWQAVGYLRVGAGATGLAVRVDALERLAREARTLAAQGAFAATPRLTDLVGLVEEDFAAVMKLLGYEARRDEAGISFAPRGRTAGPKGKAPRGKRRPRRPDGDSPFAKLRDLKIGS